MIRSASFSFRPATSRSEAILTQRGSVLGVTEAVYQIECSFPNLDKLL